MAHPPKNRRKPGAHHRPPKEKGRALAAFTGAAPAEIRFGMERETRDLVGRMLKIGFGLLCVPLSWITFETLFILVTHSVSPKGFWMTKEFAYYGLGAAIWLAFFFNLRFPTFTYLYVLGHEYTHAAAALVCRGNVTDIKVTPDGGYILTNRNNFFIALSPYIVPFYTVLLLAGWMLAKQRWNLEAHETVLYILVGLTHMFHLSYTIWMIAQPEQPDLDHSGRFFSIPFILWVNLLIISAFLIIGQSAASPAQYLGLWGHNAATFCPRLLESCREIWSFFRD
ncbi:MAG TPA: hypothetical protein P5016_11385 [Verrucomicrobiales bacterium]|nr:M50 family metallopeptidase [Verrucomicrobiae bacterium]HRX55109.1 hypothetical protein [Verrucomicrobiales bacterium]